MSGGPWRQVLMVLRHDQQVKKFQSIKDHNSNTFYKTQNCCSSLCRAALAGRDDKENMSSEYWISLHLLIIWCEVSPGCCCVSIWNVIRLLTKPRSPSAMFTLNCVFASPGIVLILPYLTYYTVSPSLLWPAPTPPHLIHTQISVDTVKNILKSLCI